MWAEKIDTPDSNEIAAEENTEPSVRVHQRLRLKRFGMAAGTYLVFVLAVSLTTRMGFAHLTGPQWIVIVGSAILINVIFFVIFLTDTNLRFKDPSLTWAQIFISALWGALPTLALAEVRPILLMFYIPAFSFGMLRLNRRQYLTLVTCVMGIYAAILMLEYSHAPAAFQVKYEFLVFAIFGIVLTWFAFFGGFISHLKLRLKEQHDALQKINLEMHREMQERIRAQVEKDRLIGELKDALSKVKTLSGLLPICAACKKIRDDKGYWNQIEHYIRGHSEAEFSHSICPECARKTMDEISNYGKKE
ncbi:MAG: hypothetical protein HY911_06585 [Desulfobacterales bacterium]|nr:hypothetical protein [Desulfobacterales bacterium]